MSLSRPDGCQLHSETMSLAKGGIEQVILCQFIVEPTHVKGNTVEVVFPDRDELSFSVGKVTFPDNFSFSDVPVKIFHEYEKAQSSVPGIPSMNFSF